MLRSMVPALLASVAVASQLEAQAVPVVSLTKPDAELAEPFDQVSGVRELSDGRVVVADLFAKQVSLADFRSGALTKIGREGQGPGEYAFPINVLALPGDTTLIVDPAQRRFVKVAPDGKPVALVSFPEGAGGMGNMRGTDAQGRIYLQASPFGPRLAGEARALREMPDSAPIHRWNPATGRIDTIAKVKLPETASATSGSAGARSVVMRQQPFSARDEWAVAPDGRVGIARVSDYHVEWHGSAKAAGPRVAAPKVPVTQADKDLIARQQNETRGRLMMREGGPPRSGGSTPPPPPKLPDADFPEFKPPFIGSALASPDGRLWVPRAQPANAPPVYDVFDARGRLVQQVKLAKGTRLVGFGATTLYTARTDEDDLQYLQRHRRPG
ncbi:MAG TPA: hypothetical protein VFT04_12905 [Gemmatimonadales bacterium]|nr:hypothetical protein [Gemmatimonadales bacterium]